MIGIFSKYVVSKTDQEFKLPTGEILPQTATVSLLNDNEEVLSTLELGVLDVGYLYERIINNQSINLDQCYIENFSLKHLREKRNLKPKQFININGFVITNSVFYSEHEIDLSYVRFDSGDFTLKSSIFLHSGVTFKHSNFGKGEYIFDSTYFHQGGVIFTNAVFGKGLLSFKNSIFRIERKVHRKEKGKRGRGRRGFGDMLNFEGAFFTDGKIDFTRANLASGGITFSNARINKRDLLFVGTEFEAVRLTFKSITLNNGKIDFHFANFGQGDLFFDRAVIKNAIIDFSATEFKRGKFSFSRTEFEKIELNFESSEIDKGKITFRNNLFDLGSINFNSVQYHSADILFDSLDFGKVTASFLRATINTLSFKSCHLNAYFNLQIQRCKSLDLSNTVVRDIVDMKPYGFNPDIHSLNLSGLLLLGNFYIDWKTNNIRDLILDQPTSNRDKSEQFRILKENYHSLGQYNAEDEAYIEFRRLESKADLESSLKTGRIFSKLKAYTKYAFKWLIFDKIGLYATNPVRVLTSMLFVYLIFVLIYFLLPYFVDSQILTSQDNGDLSQLGVAFYHSIVTFLTIGYGDYYPTGIFRWISGFEGFMGLFLISYFTVAFVRKVLR